MGKGWRSLNRVVFSRTVRALMPPLISRSIYFLSPIEIPLLQNYYEKNIALSPTAMKGLNQWIKLSLMLILMVSLTGCTWLDTQTPPSPSPHIGKSILKPVALNSKKIVAGQTIYVPVYSYIYHYDTQNQVINLAATLSIRNTDLKHPVIITKIDYYDTSGKLSKNLLENPSELPAMASADYFLPRNEVSGGLGANFWLCVKF